MNQKDFTNLYSLSKTLRFELRPTGKTLNNIKSTGILAEDNHRAESYKKVKIIIDKYHKNIIERVLSTLSLVHENHNKQDSLQEFHCYYELKSKDKKQLKKIRKDSIKSSETDCQCVQGGFEIQRNRQRRPNKKRATRLCNNGRRSSSRYRIQKLHDLLQRIPRKSNEYVFG